MTAQQKVRERERRHAFSLASSVSVSSLIRNHSILGGNLSRDSCFSQIGGLACNPIEQKSPWKHVEFGFLRIDELIYPEDRMLDSSSCVILVACIDVPRHRLILVRRRCIICENCFSVLRERRKENQ